LVGTSRLSRDVVRGVIEDDPRLDVVGEFEDESMLATAGELTEADCIVATLDGSSAELSRAYAPVIRACPRLRVVGIGEGGRRCLVYELVPRCTVVGELSPEVLVRTIRSEDADAEREGRGLR
jgi:hypothetical protein